MGSCGGFLVYGHVECARTATGGRQIVLALNPSDEGQQQAWQDLCALCDQKTDEPSHSHTLKGVLSLSPNQSQLNFTLTDCPPPPPPPDSRPEVLQYEVDGKLYELPIKKDVPKRQLKKKAKVPNKKQQTNSLANLAKEDKTYPMNATPSPLPAAQDDERTNLEVSLSLLQVKLGDHEMSNNIKSHFSLFNRSN